MSGLYSENATEGLQKDEFVESKEESVRETDSEKPNEEIVREAENSPFCLLS